MNGKANIYLNIPSIHQKSKSILHFCVRFEFLQNFPWGHGIRRFPPPASFNRVRPFRDVPSPWRPENQKFSWHHPATSPCSPGFFVFSVVFLKTRKIKRCFFAVEIIICCWLIIGWVMFLNVEKFEYKQSKYNSPTDEFYLVIVEMLNDAANMLWR